MIITKFKFNKTLLVFTKGLPDKLLCEITAVFSLGC